MSRGWDTDNHYAFLGVDMSASQSRILIAIEQLSKQANALANTSPERSHQLRERLRQVREDLLVSEEQRSRYDQWLHEMARTDAFHSPDGPAMTAQWETNEATAFERSDVPARRPSPLIWLLVVLAILLAGGVGALIAVHRGIPGLASAAAPTATPTATPIPTSTPVPTSHPTLAPTPAPGPIVAQAVRRSNDVWSASMACACDRGLASVKTGADLQKYLDQIQSLQTNGQHWQITLHSWQVESVNVTSPTTAQARVLKDESRVQWQGSSVIYSCSGPYEVLYDLIKSGGTWKVDDTTLLNDECQ